MLFILSFFIICSGYYTLTFGINMWKQDNNKLGGFGAIFLALISTIVPVAVIYIKFYS
ncbi:uncharacterized protein DUF3953 [Ruminiclostridium sufflavum DSM 19573]|uniref:Uncharacterized protein DUF3953 n=1 Tax=Ruminiclostridium sufflavum DSM 19573 TaxID=1121337 RepID=A0A318XLL6_9FIRM|nr:DUF3953 domain-containing protein [Ruminiclostridium sufflavum]PYG87397.1 uncharacterized protein DUF3953 [Ruminiclostridium sufflavum DSM 19573]